MQNPQITVIIHAIKAAGATAPKAVQDAVSVDTTLTTAAREWVGSYTDVSRAWADAVLAGRDALDDPEVHRQTIAHVLNSQSLERAAATVSEERTVAALTATQDTILSAFKKAADKAGATLTEAHKILGDISLDAAALIFKLGATAVAAHTEALEAVRTIRAIDKGWGALATLTGFASPSTNTNMRLADVPLHTYEQHRRTPDVWALVRANCTVDLAITKAELDKRTARHDREREQRTATTEADWNRAVQRAHGIAPVF